MRFATLLLATGSDSAPVELRVTPLALSARDPLANVNRWREQIGLDHIAPGQLSSVARELDIDGRTAHLVDMRGTSQGSEPARQILAAILPGDERAWFFLVMDTPDRVGPHAKSFETFMRSVRLRPATAAAGELPPGHPPLGDTAAGTTGAAEAGGMGTLPEGATGSDAPPVHWTTPPGWHEHAETNPSRLATLHVGSHDDAGARAEVTITRFPGDVGGLLPNINRWRGQLGLQPVSELSQQPLEPLQVDGTEASLVDIQGPGSGDSRQRMLVVLVPHAEFTYFVKMTGPDALVGRERAAFANFARSLRFERGAS